MKIALSWSNSVAVVRHGVSSRSMNTGMVKGSRLPAGTPDFVPAQWTRYERDQRVGSGVALAANVQLHQPLGYIGTHP